MVAHWREPDSGIWEVRNGPYHFVYSKVMCWVALDRGLIIAKRYGFAADRAAWERARAAIHHEVCARGWREERRAFVQHYDTDALDAANLLIPLVGFLPFADPRVVATIEAIQQELAEDGFIHRYRAEDGLAGGEGTFLLCSFWLVDGLVGLGRLDEAERWLARLEATANPLGLFAEEYDPHWRELLGNFPQAFTHIGYINSVLALRQARSARPSAPAPARLVCASSSCPPIAVYTAEELEAQLTIAAETFLNAGGAVVDRTREQVSLSRIFHWYAADFGGDPPAILRFIAPHLQRAEDRRYLADHADRLTVVYQDYDWRLNRS